MSLSFSTCWRMVVNRQMTACFSRRYMSVQQLARQQIPEPTAEIATPQDFLKAIGRSAETKLTIEEWDKFWTLRGPDLKEFKLSVKDRRYILWAQEKYRQQYKIKEFAHEPKPAKKFRGWGPNVQKGVRLRTKVRT